MAAKTAADLDFLGKFATRNRLEDPLSSNPSLSTSDAARVWFNSTTKKWMYWDGTAAIDPRDRSTHSGTQVASTISDLAATVQAYRLDQFAAPNTDLSIGSHKLTNVTDPSSAQDAATMGWVQAQIAALASGQVTKGAVKVAAGANISLSAPGATIDGISMSSGDIVLLTAQTTGSQNGPYVWTGASSALTRATNWDTSGEAVLGSYWVVEQGTHADSWALLTNDTAITLGTTVPAFTFISNGTTYTGTAPVSVSGTVISLNIGSGLTTSGSNLVPDYTVVGRRITGVIPTSSSGIVTVSGSTVTINHGLNNWGASMLLVAYTSPYTGYSQGDRIPDGLNGFTSQDANNITGSLPAAPGANAWFYSILG